jgi:hypothetical protein
MATSSPPALGQAHDRLMKRLWRDCAVERDETIDAVKYLVGFAATMLELARDLVERTKGDRTGPHDLNLRRGVRSRGRGGRA